MVHYDYICDACGFKSEEERGVYICPECGSQMRIAKTGVYSGDSSSTVGRLILTIVCFFVSLFLGIVVLGPFGIPAAIILTIIVWRITKKAYQDRAIRSGGVRNPNKRYVCSNCGGKFKGQLPNCPHCGLELTYKMR